MTLLTSPRRMMHAGSILHKDPPRIYRIHTMKILVATGFTHMDPQPMERFHYLQPARIPHTRTGPPQTHPI
jgi:hypothetical protein